MAQEPLYAVRRAFPSYAGLPADTGAVFPLGGHPGDEKLLRLGFVEPVQGSPKLATCGVCGTKFLSGKYREAHGDRRHAPAPEPPVVGELGHALEGLGYSPTGIAGAIVPDLTGDAEERRLNQDAPIYWEKTAASQKG
jgi:hypothetical protein